MRDASWITDARESYDRVAGPYAELTRGGLAGLPLEEALLVHFARQVVDAGGGRVLDVGCGPGWLTGRLALLGLAATGTDVSPVMLRLARRNHPDVGFVTASVTRLPVADGSVAGLLCWYVLHHVPDEDLGTAVGELARVLAPGGSVMLGGHVGAGSSVKNQGYGGLTMRVLVARRSPERYASLLRDAGLVVDATVTLGPQDSASGAVWLAHRPT